MSSKKNLQKELKQPDKFQTQVFQLSGWVSQNSALIKKIAYPIVAIVIFIAGFNLFQESQKENRIAELSQIDIKFAAEETVAQDQRKKLTDEITELVKQETKAKLDKSTPSPSTSKADASKEAADVGRILDLVKISAKKKKLEEKVETIEADHEQTKALLLAFFEGNESFPEGWNAGLRAANIQVANKEFKEAAKTLEKVLAGAKGVAFYDSQVRMLYVSVLEELGQYDEALKVIDMVVQVSKSDLLPRVLLAKGRIEILKDKKAEAFVTFKGLIAKHGSSREATKARTIMALWR